MENILLRDIIKAVNGKLLNDKDIDKLYITNVIIDSRKAKEMSLFVPIVGERVDGHDFISVAFENGAICALSEKEKIETKEDYIIIYVDSTVKALGDLAKFYCSLFNSNIIEITGSVGKTTTKDMLASVLNQRFITLKTEGNYNNEIGLPLTLFRLNKEIDIVVLELGMSQLDEIKYLGSIPKKADVAVITNIGTSHIENLGSREGILKAKTEIFDSLDKNAIILLNSDDDMLLTLKDNPDFPQNKIWWFGIENKIHTYADNIELLGLDGVNCDIHLENYNNEILRVHIPSPGKHIIYATLIAVSIARYYEIPLEEIRTGIENFIPTQMRMNIIKSKNFSIINDAYNASPQSMKSALDVLKLSGNNRKVAILGDMFEMGDYAPDMHREIGEYAINIGIDVVICIGKLAKYIYNSADINKNSKQIVLYFEKQENLYNKLFEILKKYDIILVKASRGMALEKTIDKIEKVEL